jgi:tetratricopeptide (TPR) repeat protein
MVYAKQRRFAEALEALGKAESLDAGFSRTYLYRGKVYLLMGKAPEAVENYRRALALDPTLEEARQDLAQIQAKLSAMH